MMKLYQFPFSHFCEKARWALDYKRISYHTVNLLPGLHARTVKKHAPKSCVPLLVDGPTVIQESSNIISYLDQRAPTPTLTPFDPVQAELALKWESELDEQVGITLRLWYYHQALPNREVTMQMMLDGAPWYASPLFALFYPRIREAMRESMGINPDTAEQARRCLYAMLQRLDDVLADQRFLVGL